MVDHNYKLQTRANEDQIAAREVLHQLFKNNPLPTDQLMTNLGLFLRSSVMAKFLYINELYEHIIGTPGVIMEFGVWWGQNIVLLESLRAIYEPYNYTRKIIGFDTFTGYPAVTPEDGQSRLATVGGYAVTENYEKDFLAPLLDYHERENTMSHIKKYELRKGDAAVSIQQYLEEHPETIIAFAYFDMQLYEPTKKCLEAIKPYLTRGSVIALDELNSNEYPGETIALKEVWPLDKVKLVRSRFLPDRSYMILD